MQKSGALRWDFFIHIMVYVISMLYTNYVEVIINKIMDWIHSFEKKSVTSVSYMWGIICK